MVPVVVADCLIAKRLCRGNMIYPGRNTGGDIIAGDGAIYVEAGGGGMVS